MAVIRGKENIRWDLESKLDLVIKKLQEYAVKYEGKNPTIDFDEYDEFGCACVDVNLEFDREETPEEIFTRENKEKLWKKMQDNEDRRNYERLKKQFEGKK